MQNHVVVVDGNSIAHANHNANVLTVGTMQVQAIFGMLKSLRAILQGIPGEKRLITFWDGKAEFRKELFPEYKGNREAMTPEEEASKAAFQRQTPFIEKSLELLGVRQYRSPLLEADDLAGHIIPRLSAAGTKVTMISGDKDWIQLVDENVTWVDPIRARSVNMSNFLEFTGYFNSAAFVQGKALVGDNSDNINGIYKLGDVTAQMLLAEWKDMNLFFKAVDDGTYTPKTRKSKTAASLHPEQLLASPEGRALFQRNVKLMDLRLSRKPAPGEMVIRDGKADIAAFELFCHRMAFRSILAEWGMFLKAFNLQPLKESK
jgi:5'-3' exonuclease